GSRDPSWSYASGFSSLGWCESRPRGSGGGEPAGRYEDGSKMTSKRRAFQTPLRRSISEQLRDSTARAWDLLWKNVRERRLAGRCPRDSGTREGETGGSGCVGSSDPRGPTVVA
ncbi:Hypothetical predicted protein, partial [Marmota monax]